MRIETDRIVLDRGETTTSTHVLHVDCSARGLADAPATPRLNAAGRRLRAANDQLRPGMGVDPLRAACDRAAANSQPAAAPDRARERRATSSIAAAVGAGRLYWEIHGAFWDYQQTCEQRRQLAFEVGELAQQLTDALIGAGWSPTDAHTADVYQLAGQQARR